MIEYSLDTEHSILLVQPKSAIEKDDFVKLAKAVDPHIEATGGLAGLIVEAPSFPGWKSFGAMVKQFRFVRDHHKRLKRIGIVTNSALGNGSRLTGGVNRFGRRFPRRSGKSEEGAYVRVEEGIACRAAARTDR